MPTKKKKKVKVEHICPAGRLDLVIDPDLKNWAKSYARRRHTSLTAIIIQHLVDLQDRDRGCNVEQI